MVSLSRKTSCAAQVALQHCPILHMSKRKSMIPTEFHTVNWLDWLRKPGSKPSGQVAQFAPDLRLRRTGISSSCENGTPACLHCLFASEERCAVCKNRPRTIFKKAQLPLEYRYLNIPGSESSLSAVQSNLSAQ